MHYLTSQVYKYCIKNELLRPGMKIVAGISGGADSVCMLKMLMEMSAELSLDIICVHIEHGIRGEESRHDMEFVRNLCKDLKVPLTVYEEDVPARAREFSMTVEEAGRHIRYEAFGAETERSGADAVAVAHHLDDQAETVLFNLIRGSGLKGVSGIAPKRGNVIRPLLCITREQIEEYLDDIGQPYCIDSTNTDTEYSRNGIRGLIIPGLEGIVKGAAGHIARAADEIREADDHIRSEAKKARSEMTRIENACVKQTGSKDDENPCDHKARIYRIDTGMLLDTPAIIRRYVIRSILTDIYTTHKDLEALHVNEVLSLADKQSGRSIMLPKGITAAREGDSIVIGSREAVLPGDHGIKETELETNGDTLIPDRGVISAVIEEYDGSKPPDGLYTKWFDYDKMMNTVLVRTRREGDYLSIGREGQHKKLKKYLIDEKVPASERGSVLLLADGDHVIWVIGMRISEYYKISAATRRVLKLSYREASE